MKTIFNLLTVAIIALAMFTACQEDNGLVPEPVEISVPADSMKDTISVSKTTFVTNGNVTITPPALKESDVQPRFGKPNATKYYFSVYDVAGNLEISVKLYEKAGGKVKYLPMSRIGNYWSLSTEIEINGWYDWRYVYSVNKSNISSKSYTLCNTYNTFDPSDISSITWPFGEDGSSWGVRNVIVNSFFMKWRGGEENGALGYGWETETHKGYREAYSDDWNRGIGTQDMGAEVRSPLDGVIEEPNGSYSTSYGSSKFVSIIQEGEDGRTYRFYVAHLDKPDEDLYKGKYVRAGVTKIGTIGKSGASSPHAHCNLRDITGGDDKSIKFYFDAIK